MTSEERGAREVKVMFLRRVTVDEVARHHRLLPPEAQGKLLLRGGRLVGVRVAAAWAGRWLEGGMGVGQRRALKWYGKWAINRTMARLESCGVPRRSADG